jgi:hypothetical protein
MLGGILGNGTKVAYSLASPISWVAVGQILDQEIPKLQPDKVETTVQSTSALRRHIRGLITVTPLALKLLQDLDPATSADQTALRDLQSAGTTIWWRVEVPTQRDQSEYMGVEFEGWVENFGPSAPIDDKQVLDLSVQFDGDDLYWDTEVGASEIS